MDTNEKLRTLGDKLETSRKDTLALTAELTEAQWQTTIYSEGAEWRAIEILRHTVDSEASMTALMKRIQSGGPGVPDDFDLERWNSSRVAKRQDMSVDELRAEMVGNREQLLLFIDGLDELDWQKSGRHGSMRVMTIEEICNLIADHEALHVADIRGATG